jgi:iduronate 2-sulfatase
MRGIRVVGLIAALGLLGVVGELCAAAGDKLNVLFIAVDDLRPELGCYGHPMVKSPNIDRLAAQGLLFNRVYCQMALCMPSRSSLLSGYRPETLRNGNGPLSASAPKDIVTLPQLFRSSGYTTVSTGKVYHYNADDVAGWVRRYTDTFAEGPGFCSGYQLPENRAKVRYYFPALKGETDPSRPRPPMCECTDTPDEAHPDEIISWRAIEELKGFKARGESFFLAAGFYRPHMPWTPPKKYWDLYDRAQIQLPANYSAPDDGIPRDDWYEVRGYGDAPEKGLVPPQKAREMMHGYYASVSFVDAQVGKVLDALHRLDLDKNTIVILWSDNGWNLGDHGRWSKYTNSEPSTRVVMMVSGPGIPGNQKTNALVELIDIYPSLCELCGLTPPEYLEGTSFVPLLQASQRPWKTAAFSCLFDYKTLTVRTDRYRLIQHAEGQIELYDYQQDPAEDHNLASDLASQGVLQGLQAALRAGWRSAQPPHKIGG